MLCCLGLVAGLAVGSALGGPWALIASVAGLGLGLIGDLTLIKHDLHSIHKNAEQWIRTRQSELRHEELKEV
jgi:predicted ABC-type transport system involved in lysophospholipase L1 biosynthesis ATPase subunit